jgi:hypothetical protein
MAFPSGWRRRCLITIDKDKVDATQSNYTVYLKEDNLPSEMFDADGTFPANSDGGDIRFSADKAGASPLAREVVEFTRDNDPANGTAQIHVLVSSVSSSVDTEIYVWYNNSLATEPAEDATYGRENAWHSNYKAVWHLEESGDGTTDEYLESTSNDNDGTGGDGVSSKTPTQTTAEIDYRQDCDGTDDFINCSNGSSLDVTTQDFTAQFIINMDTIDTVGSSGQSVFMVKGEAAVNGYYIQQSANNRLVVTTNHPGLVQTYSAINVLSAGQTALFHFTKEGTGSNNVKIYKDGSDTGYTAQGTHGNITTSSDDFELCRYPYDVSLYHLDGWIDEPRVIVGEVFDGDRCATEYNNLRDTANFASAGTPEPAGLPGLGLLNCT